MNCPPPQSLQQFLDDTLANDEERSLAVHIETCADCQHILERLTTLDAHRERDGREHLNGPHGEFTPAAGPVSRSKSSLRLSDHQLAQLTPLLSASQSEEPFVTSSGRNPQAPTFAGYEVLAEIAQGGMGTVYQARDLRLGRLVAIKRLKQSELQSPDELVRFRAETQTIARLDHPNIVRLLEFGSHDQVPYCVLEYIDGGSLEDRLTGAPWSPDDAAQLVETIALAIEYSHQHGIVHRDLKPGNILLPCGDNNRPRLEAAKVADFGLAKQTQSDLSLTTTGTLAGTPSYMAPEQVRGESNRIGPVTDVYALGAVLYELLTGRTPFSGVTQLEVMNQILEQEPLPPSRIVPQVPRDLESICLQCLSKEPGRRYPSAASLANDLNCFRQGRPVSARTSSLLDRSWKWTRRKPALAALLATIMLAATVGLPTITLLWLDAASSRDRAQRSEQAQRWASYRANMAAAGSFLQLNNADAAQRALDAAPNEYRNWEWRHFQRRIESQRIALVGHEDLVWSGVFSPDGKRVASVSKDSTVRLWDAQSGELIRKLPTHPYNNRRSEAVFSPDGQLLAAPGTEQTIQLADAQTGATLGTLSGHTSLVAQVAFSPDGQWLFSRPVYGHVEDKSVRLWNVRTLAQVNEWELEVPAHTIEFSPDGHFMAASTGEGGLRLWSGGESQLLPRWRHHDKAITAVAFRPDSRQMVASQGEHIDTTVRILSLPDLAEVAAMTGHGGPVHALRYSPDGKVIASASEDQTLRLWDATNGEALQVLSGHRGPVNDARFSPDGQTLATASSDHTVRIWNPNSGALQGVLFGHSAGVNTLVFDSTGERIVTASDDGTLSVWDLTQAIPTRTLNGHTSYVYDVAYSPDGKTAASASWDGTFRIWNLANGEELSQLERESPSIATGVAYGPRGERLATWERDALRLWDVATGECLQRVEVPFALPHNSRIAFSRDGTLIATGSSAGEIYWWEGPAEQLTKTPAHELECVDVAISPDSRCLVSAGRDAMAFAWDTTTKEKIAELSGHNRRVNAVDFSADGALLATGSEDGTVRLWDANRFTLTAVLRHGTKVYDVAFHPDGERLATACADNSIRIWDVATGDHVAELRGHEAYVHGLAFNADGTRLLSASGDNTVRLWVAE